jgi:hypothetical protein
MSSDDFFGGSIKSSPTPAPGRAKPPHTGAYADFRPPRTAPPSTITASGTSLSPQLVLAVIAVIGLIGGFFFVRSAMAGPSIEIPKDSLIGISAMDNSSPLVGQLESAWDQAKSQLNIDADIEVGAYQAGEVTLVVAAAEWGTDDAAKQDAFFSGLNSGAGSLPTSAQFQSVDAGPKGGQMRCMQQPGSTGVGVCVWIDKGTIGIVALNGAGMDLAGSAREVRDEVEH